MTYVRRDNLSLWQLRVFVFRLTDKKNLVYNLVNRNL